MKVLFLDIDGVLNNFTSRNFGEQFSPSSCACLKQIMDAVPELKIVVSSAWRMHGLAYMQRILHKNGIDATRVIDCTGREDGFRGHQIQCWLDRNPGVTNMVILDDDSDMGALLNKLVKTRSFKGLTDEEVPLALDVLSKPMN
jgi:HAD domain in Swiss Army Knife RNA repair proteins